jgi:large subunit ribosomal protein L21
MRCFSVEPMYAVIRTGGKQLRVSANDRIVVERLAGDPGEVIAFDDVLMLGESGAVPMLGAAIPGTARVFARVVAQQRGPKLLIFKKKRRKNHRRIRGHRQEQTILQVTGISASGEAPAASAEPVAEATPAPIPATDAGALDAATEE